MLPKGILQEPKRAPYLLLTEVRSPLLGHEAGNGGYMPRGSLRLRPVLSYSETLSRSSSKIRSRNCEFSAQFAWFRGSRVSGSRKQRGSVPAASRRGVGILQGPSLATI